MAERSKAEERLIRHMTRYGGRGFRILRSAETPMKRYVRTPTIAPTPAPSVAGAEAEDERGQASVGVVYLALVLLLIVALAYAAHR